MATYVSLVNNAIDESGADLALYAEDGSDFTTNTEPMLNRFKTWVARAWKTVQQVAFDWEFLNNQAIVTLQPGLMFYCDGDILGTAGSTVDVYEDSGTLIVDDLEVGRVKDLTYSQYSDSVDKSLGYVDINDSRLASLTFMAGSDYFELPGRLRQVVVSGNIIPQFDDANMFVGDILSFILLDETNALIGVFNDVGELTTLDPASGSSRGSTSYTFVTDNDQVATTIASGNFHLYGYNFNVSLPTGWVLADGLPTGMGINRASSDGGTNVVSDVATKCYLHSWKSFLFSEEKDSNDYVHELSEIDNNSFHIIDHEADSPSTTRPLTFVPWHIFSVQYDNLTTPPSTPIYITEDNTGRWRLYPHPDRPVTLKFSYSRTPQNLAEWDDEPKGLPADFTDLVMWLAVRMYGEFDEQPSVARRAERYYKDLLQRLQIKYRPKFHIKPKRLY